MTNFARPPRLLLALTVLLAIVAGAMPWLGVSPLYAEGVVREVTVSAEKILADGGETTVTVDVGGTIDEASEVVLSTTLGAFGATGGPSRIVLPLDASDEAISPVSAELFGDGRRGTAVVTARVGESVRTASVVMVGSVAVVEFESPADGAVLDASMSHRIEVRVRDAGGVTVPGVEVTLVTDSGTLTEDDAVSASLRLSSDEDGGATARLEAEPGNVRLMATAGDVSASLDLVLHGPLVSLELVALRSSLHVGDEPVPPSEGTLVAILLDAGGRPVPLTVVSFETDRDDVVVLHTGSDESIVTDAGGRTRGHLSAASATEPGVAVVTARADGVEGRVEVTLVGPPAQLVINVSSVGPGVYQLNAIVRDELGTALPDGYRLLWEVTGVGPEGAILLEPRLASVMNGGVEALLTLSGDVGEEIGISATVLGVEPPLENSVTITEPATVEGPLLSTGLNVVTWATDDTTASEVAASLAAFVVAIWRLDSDGAWQGFFPDTTLGVNFPVVDGELLYIFLNGASALAGAELAPVFDEPLP